MRDAVPLQLTPVYTGVIDVLLLVLKAQAILLL